ncbi:hypothetical protein E2C01_011879 [Portunus trituberculatus]|uniref:Uncharacterized protein n=1 Tax=Portunus trituberculatus TaxID=210409 RepID=A0A5B7DC99_PORTR|nr:hypothetical protein [Portunus trituberculatus]
MCTPCGSSSSLHISHSPYSPRRVTSMLTCVPESSTSLLRLPSRQIRCSRRNVVFTSKNGCAGALEAMLAGIEIKSSSTTTTISNTTTSKKQKSISFTP